MEAYSVVFCGTPAFACPSLQALASDSAFTVTHVITQPDKPVGRKLVMTPPPVKVLAEKLGILALQPEDINSGRRSEGWQVTSRPLTQLGTGRSPDFLVTVAYGQILGSELLAWPIIAAVNLHPSLLPKLRGATPIEHAILEDMPETGVTIQRMVEKLDAGPIFSQERVRIDARETRETLIEKLAIESAALLVSTLKQPLHEIPQNESEATFCKKLSRADGIVDPARMTAEEIDRRVRALVPWPGVTMHRNNEPVKLLVTSLEPHRDALTVSCAKNSLLYILKMQSPGRNAVTGAEWGRGLGN